MDTTTYLLQRPANAQRLLESIAELAAGNGTRTMTPPSNLCGNLQVKIAMKLMLLLKEGEVSAEVSIQTSKNVKVADVAWASAEFISQHGFETPYSMAPEICVEVISPGNTKGEMAEKRESCILPRVQRRCGSVMRAVRWNSSPMKAGLWNHEFVQSSL